MTWASVLGSVQESGLLCPCSSQYPGAGWGGLKLVCRMTAGLGWLKRQESVESRQPVVGEERPALRAAGLARVGLSARCTLWNQCLRGEFCAGWWVDWSPFEATLCKSSRWVVMWL